MIRFFGVPLDRLPKGNILYSGLILIEPKTKAIEEKIQAHLLPHRIAKSGKGGTASDAESFEFLDSFYENLSSHIPVKVEMSTEEYELPLVNYGYENFDPNEHEAENINFGRMIADPESPFGRNINFQIARYHYPLNILYKVNKKRENLDICFIIDTSGSMAGGGDRGIVPWGDESKYHYALLGLYGIIKYMQEEGSAHYLLWNIINFGSETRASGWKNHKELQVLKKFALTPQFGGTWLDINVVKDQLQRKHSIVIILSDGAIYNWKNIRDELKPVLEGHFASFVGIGFKTRVFSELESWGVKNFNIKDNKDLVNLMIDVARKGSGAASINP